MTDIRATRVSAFAGMAVLSTAQDLIRAALPGLGEAAQPDVVAEETLALVATVSARAAEVGLRSEEQLAQSVGAAVLETPFLYHDLLLGAQLLEQGAEGEVEVDQSVYDRLQRKMEFYAAHFPPGRLPGAVALRAQLPLWMGRISPRNLPSAPEARVEETGAIELLATHLRLVMAFAHQALQGRGESEGSGEGGEG